MGRNRRKKKGRGLALASSSGDGGETRLEEPLLANDEGFDVESQATRPNTPGAPGSSSGSRSPKLSPTKRSPPAKRSPTPKTPRSPMSIPKPRNTTTSPLPSREALHRRSSSEELITEPLLPQSEDWSPAPPGRPPRMSRDGEMRLSVTFQEPVSHVSWSAKEEDEDEEEKEDEDADADADEEDVYFTRGRGARGSSPASASDAYASTALTPFSNRVELAAIWELGWPMGVSYFCRMAMASTDSVMVGHYSGGHHRPGDYLAASALSDMLTTLMVVPPLAFNQVLNALCGQAVGSGNREMAGVWLQQSAFWLGVTMIPCLVGFFFVEDILRALGFEDTTCELAGKYAKYNVLWPVPNGWYQCMRFYFQAIGKPKPAMWNGIAFLFVNAFLNWVFVFGGPFRFFTRTENWRGLGFVGAAISLSCSRTLQPLVYWAYMFQYKKAHAAHWPDGGFSSWRRRHTKKVTLEFLKQAVPLVGALVFGAAAGQATTLLVSRLGVDAVAATTAVSTATVMWSGAINAMFSMVIAVRVGFHLGRGDGESARRSFWLATRVVFLVLAAIVASTLPFTKQVVSVTTSDLTVVANASRVLPAALFATLLGVLNALCTGGVFNGQGRTRLVACLSFFVDIPLSVGGVAAVVVFAKGATLSNVYEYQMCAALLELSIAYAFIGTSDWKRYAAEARDRQAAR